MSQEPHDTGVRKSTVYFYGVSFLYTIVIGVAGGILLNRLIAFEPPSEDITVLNAQQIKLELVGEKEELGLSVEIQPTYADQTHGQMILAPIFREALIDIEGDSVFQLVISNRGEEARSFANATGDVTIRIKSGAEFLSQAWPDNVEHPRLKQFLPGATLEPKTRASFWFRVEQPVAFEDIVSAEVRFADQSVVGLKQIHRSDS